MIDEPINSNAPVTDESEPVGDDKVSAAIAEERAETENALDAESADPSENASETDVDPAGTPIAESAVADSPVEIDSVSAAQADDTESAEDAGAASEIVESAAEDEVDEEVDDENVEPIELIEESEGDDEKAQMDWYILKVQVNRESSICEALERRVKVAGLESFFDDILVPTEDVREFTKSGKQKVVKRKLYPGYIVVHMAINDDTWFLVRETPGIGDFTGSAGKPTPMATHEIDRILKTSKPSEDDDDKDIKTTIKFKPGNKVRVKEGYFQNFEGDVEAIDEANGRITVMINIFGRSTPVELEHWQVEDV